MESSLKVADIILDSFATVYCGTAMAIWRLFIVNYFEKYDFPVPGAPETEKLINLVVI